MAAPLLKENRAKIVDYLSQRNLSDLTGVKIKELVKEDLGISISQPTASKLKEEILDDDSEDEVFTDDESLKRPALSGETDAMVELTKSDNIRHLSPEQMNALEHMLQGHSDRAVAEAVGVSRQVVWDWRNNDPLFIAELNRQRVELWREARERLRSLANHALDVLEQQLNSGDPKAALAAAKYVLQGTKLLGDTDLSTRGPTTPEGVILGTLRMEARRELEAKIDPRKPRDPLADLYEMQAMDEEAEVLAQSRLKKALADAGLS